MSDFPNGRPPGQNNIDATTERYVDPANDPSANAVKPDSEQPKESGIEVREEIKPEVQAELDQASKNIVEPGSVEDNQQEEDQGPQAQPVEVVKPIPTAEKPAEPKSTANK